MITLRAPSASDGTAVWDLVRASETLDVNSRYAYVAITSHFAATSVVAVDGPALRGVVTGYRLPYRPDVLFVWQVAVDAEARGQGLALRMLKWLLDAPRCRGVAWLETTVTPSNEPSRRLFHRLAADRGAACAVGPGFGPELLGEAHEPEELFRIGPFPRSTA